MKFSYRSYQDGDAVAINELYRLVTGRSRTIQQHAWQWLQSPAGASEMWLIEGEDDAGQKHLIGHHGVMAEQFTFRGEPMRVGKTENTMVHPEFRDKIVYPRFELAFLKQYETRFHALFSTVGPPAAMRLRAAMGYAARHQWTSVYLGAEPLLSLALIIGRLRANKHYDAGHELPHGRSCQVGSMNVEVLDPAETSFDFDKFWSKASKGYGLTPARTRANLEWRFWRNPYRRYLTVKLTSETGAVCICVLEVRPGRLVALDDIYSDVPQEVPAFIECVYLWTRRIFGAWGLVMHTTSDVCADLRAKSFRKPWIRRFLEREVQTTDRKMPRKITEHGKAAGLGDDSPWYVTPFYLEGR